MKIKIVIKIVIMEIKRKKVRIFETSGKTFNHGALGL
jgi:hypothetical protein